MRPVMLPCLTVCNPRGTLQEEGKRLASEIGGARAQGRNMSHRIGQLEEQLVHQQASPGGCCGRSLRMVAGRWWGLLVHQQARAGGCGRSLRTVAGRGRGVCARLQDRGRPQVAWSPFWVLARLSAAQCSLHPILYSLPFHPQEVQYNADFQVVQMERRVSRAEGHRSKDETEALSARIRGLEAQLQVRGDAWGTMPALVGGRRAADCLK